jgi:hypothetical protein
MNTEHRHSDYAWTWHCKFGKPGEFETDKLWKVTRAVIKSMAPGFTRLKHIFKLSGKGIGLGSDDGLKYRREEDMTNRVLAVMAAICSKFPLSVYDNEVMRWHLNELNPKHRPPHRLERNRITEVMIDFVMREMKQIMEERRGVLSHSFLSVNTDFWTDSHRKECFGAIVSDIIAEKYMLDDGRELFMSKKTAKGVGDQVLSNVSSFLLLFYCCIHLHLTINSAYT